MNIKKLIKNSPLSDLAYYIYYIFRPDLKVMKCQTDESDKINKLLNKYSIRKSFIEFGFGVYEFNCIGLVNTFRGLLIDADAQTVRRARRIYPNNIEIIEKYLNINNLNILVDYQKKIGGIGILSIDVDGMDYYFLEKLLESGLLPDLIIIEYNASFMHRSITVPYSNIFDRHKAHKSGWYHGASLSAITKLAEKNCYDLVDVTESGLNAFFIRRDLNSSGILLKPESCYKQCRMRNDLSGTNAAEQWEKIKHLKFIDIN